MRKTPAINVQDELKHAMLNYLQKRPHYDSTRVKYEVVNVAFFEDTTYYICDFKVRMKIPSQRIDTVGIMTGKVSKDFSVVHRTD
jgi:hypothetical protein